MRLTSVLALLAAIPLTFASPVEQTNAVELKPRQSGCGNGVPKRLKRAIVKKIKAAKIVPDLIPKLPKPKVLVTGAYEAGPILFGNKFTTAETTLPPTINFTKEHAKPTTTLYSVFMIDPDVPMAKPAALSKPFLHWYYAHAQPQCVASPDLETVTTYELPTPASPSQHRYTFLVYREPAGYTPKVAPAQIRLGFNVVKYAKNAGLKLVGINYFREAITNV